ncbi:MAG: Rne/Rng family ribonuclease [Bryobacteraceae bacterium]
MGKELVISSNRHETKVAMLEDDQLVEIYFQRAQEYSLAGSIHKGRVTRVLPGMQSAFVDIGLDRDAFLYVSDFFEDNEEYEKVAGAAEEKALKAERPGAQRPAPVAEIAPPAELPAAPAAPAPVAAPPAAAPTRERGEEFDRDRRGRRTRRRRTRGGRGGLPESKYARPEETSQATPAPEAATVEPPQRVESANERGTDSEFPVLPGETLAKYRHPEKRAFKTAGGSEPEEFEAAGVPEVIEEAEPAVSEAEASSAEPVLATAPPCAEELAPEAAIEKPIGGEAAFEEPASSSPEPLLEAPAAGNDPPPAVSSNKARHEESAAPQEAAQADAKAAPESSEEEPADADFAGQHDEPALLTELPDSLIPESSEPGEVGEPQSDESAETAGPESEEVEPARMPVSLTATLREQGHRIMHRVSRRTRRKMRGPELNPEGRTETAEPAPAPVEEVAAPEPSNGREPRGPRPDRKPEQQSIAELLKEGQEILVQIAKEPLGQKGARITSHIALPGRFVVYMPTVEHLGVSRKISTDEERLRLKRILQNHHTGISGGFIVRTAGEGKSEEDIAADMRFLFNMWLDIRQKAEARPAPALIHHDLDLVSRILRDQMAEPFKTIWVDNEEFYEGVLRFVQRFQPSAVNRVKLYTRDAPIFDAFGINSEIEKALRPKVWLKSGGYIVINQTEALVAIDVNTGKFVGRSNRLEDTIVKTNTEAVREIVRQVRLRDLGGIIVVDFIDMDERKNRQKVMQALEEAMRADKAPNKILQFNDFGLVAITRKRVKQSLERTLCAPCPYCEGAGYVKSVSTIVGEVLQEAHKIAKVVDGKDVTLRVNPVVAKFLKSNDNDQLEELEEILGRPVLIVSDPLLQQEKFDLI